MKKIEDLIEKWLPEIINTNIDKYMKIESASGESDCDSYTHKISFCIYTNNYTYIFKCIDNSFNDGYLCCSCESRKTLSGENWLRGNDLIDGDFSLDTWEKIKCHIIKNELVKLGE